jgi:hypothetical protein
MPSEKLGGIFLFLSNDYNFLHPMNKTLICIVANILLMVAYIGLIMSLWKPAGADDMSVALYLMGVVLGHIIFSLIAAAILDVRGDHRSHYALISAVIPMVMVALFYAIAAMGF